MSAEHVITGGLFPSRIVNAQLPVMLTQTPTAMSRANLKARVLCANHNNALSDVDAEMIRLSRALQEHVNSAEPGELYVTVDGRKIERWCIKTSINLLASRWMQPWDFTPPLEVVRAAFGQIVLPGGAGLYALKWPLIRIPNGDVRVGFNLISKTDNASQIAGVYFPLFYLQLIIGLFPGFSVEVLRSIGKTSETMDWSQAKVDHRPSHFTLGFQHSRWQGRCAHLHVTFTWAPDAPRAALTATT